MLIYINEDIRLSFFINYFFFRMVIDLVFSLLKCRLLYMVNGVYQGTVIFFDFDINEQFCYIILIFIKFVVWKEYLIMLIDNI